MGGKGLLKPLGNARRKPVGHGAEMLTDGSGGASGPLASQAPECGPLIFSMRLAHRGLEEALSVMGTVPIVDWKVRWGAWDKRRNQPVEVARGHAAARLFVRRRFATVSWSRKDVARIPRGTPCGAPYDSCDDNWSTNILGQ